MLYIPQLYQTFADEAGQFKGKTCWACCFYFRTPVQQNLRQVGKYISESTFMCPQFRVLFMGQGSEFSPSIYGTERKSTIMGHS